MFSESGTTAHLYLFIAAVVLFSIFLVYVYVHNHRTSAEDSGFWTKVFYHNDMGEYLPHITHDDDVWYYKGRNTCVAYCGHTEPTDRCPRNESYCAGVGEPYGAPNSYGSPNQQVQAIRLAIEKGGEHPLCPLIYAGAD